MEEAFDIARIRFDDKGLVPCIVQDYETKRVLTLAYMNRESLAITLEKGLTCFWSRSRKELWLKGETSGNYQHIVRMEADCDCDAILVLVRKDGPACHHGTDSCFDASLVKTWPEMIDVYDANRKRTGRTVPRKQYFLKKGEYMLYVLAILEDTAGRILVTRRALDKKWAAGSWEIPGGGADAGEDSFTAVVREVSEETGLDISGMHQAPVYSYVNEDLARGDNYFVDIYHFRFPFTLKDVTLQKSEAIDVKLATIQEITEMNQQHAFLHYQRICKALKAEVS